MTDEHEGAWTIADLVARAEKYEALAAALRTAIAELRQESAVRTTTAVEHATTVVQRARNGTRPTKLKRGDTTATVFRMIRERPGLTSTELAEWIAPQLRSATHNPKKLVHSTLGYLRVDKKTIRKDEEGRYFPVG